MNMQLIGKVALVTGSNSGIGAKIAEMLAEEGATVVVHGRNRDRAEDVSRRILQQGGKSYVVCGDLAVEGGAETVAREALELAGQVDILVNNAGGSGDVADRSWFGASTDIWRETFSANVLAAVRLIHVLSPAMCERGWGRIINISTAAAITPTSGQPDYAAAKAAMLSMSLGLSKALKGTGVTSNSVSPGMIRTTGLNDFLRQFSEKRGWGADVAKAEEYIVRGSGQTVARVGEVEDIAYAVTWLASPCSGFINGTNLHIDGGASPSVG
jgi:3-oxoacyl-[acyl-carrier protein] reductase